MSEKKLLKVGDKIYCSSKSTNSIKSINKVQRVTKTLAILDNGQRFKLDISDYGQLYEYPYQPGLKHWYYEVETEKTKQRFEIQKLKKEIADKLHSVNSLLGKLELLEDFNSKLSIILNTINSIPKESEDV